MKLSSYLYQGKPHYGIVTEQGIIDLTCRLGQQYPTLKSLLAASALELAEQWLDEEIDFDFEQITFLPVITHPGKIICAGMNYLEKRQEFNESNPAPTLFIRFADSQTGHNTEVLKSAPVKEFDFEGELAVVMGRSGRNISADHALDYVAGYSCYMDGSARDWQHTWYTAGKNWPKSGAFGPWLVTQSDIPDPQVLSIKTYLNGQLMQDDNTQNMIYSVKQLIAYISTFTPLQAGDVIITGSPGGVGKKRTPPLFMKAGDRIEVEIDRIGRLSNTVAEI